MPKKYFTVLTIAGSDCSGGAGIQADIKTIAANGGYAASVLTALTAQNTQGVTAIEKISPAFITKQLNAVFTDIKIDAVKIGMLYDKQVINSVSKALLRFKAKNIVLDPVMIAKGGAKLIKPNVIQYLKSHLFPLVSLITPNIPEAEILYGHKITSKHAMEIAAKNLAHAYNINVLIKGGHLAGKYCHDVCYIKSSNAIKWFSNKRINTNNSHGTGCSLSSAIATFLAKGHNLHSAIEHANQYVNAALKAGKNYQLGQGCGPIHHFYQLDNLH